MTPIEREFKWAVNSHADFAAFVQALQELAGYLPSPKNYPIVDSYLENKEQSLCAQKIALRVRQVGEVFEATMKSRTQLVGGMACREEHTLALPVKNVQDALAFLEEKKQWQGISMQGLAVRFKIKNTRQVYDIIYKDIRCEVALDEYEILAGDAHKNCQEIEMELKEGGEKYFLYLVEKISAKTGLQAAQISKVATAEKMIKT